MYSLITNLVKIIFITSLSDLLKTDFKLFSFYDVDIKIDYL